MPGRPYSAVRMAIIGYGAVAFGYLQSGMAPADAPRALGGFASPQGLLIAGLALQLLLMIVRALVKRFATDDAALAQGMEMTGLAGDAVTVLLFALGTYGAIASAGSVL